jgi:formate hydrogenlyase transcriptional activator
VILSNDGVLPNPLPVKREVVTDFSNPVTLRGSERALILHTLESVGWVIGGAYGAASKLGVKRTTLIHRMKKLGISRPSRHNKAEFREQLQDTESQAIQ